MRKLGEFHWKNQRKKKEKSLCHSEGEEELIKGSGADPKEEQNGKLRNTLLPMAGDARKEKRVGFLEIAKNPKSDFIKSFEENAFKRATLSATNSRTKQNKSKFSFPVQTEGDIASSPCSFYEVAK